MSIHLPTISDIIRIISYFITKCCALYEKEKCVKIWRILRIAAVVFGFNEYEFQSFTKIMMFLLHFTFQRRALFLKAFYCREGEKIFTNAKNVRLKPTEWGWELFNESFRSHGLDGKKGVWQWRWRLQHWNFINERNKQPWQNWNRNTPIWLHIVRFIIMKFRYTFDI